MAIEGNSLDIDELVSAFWNTSNTLSNSTHQQVTQNNVKRTRVDEYTWRSEASKDGLIKSIISAHYVNAVGVEDETRPNISVHTNKEYRDKAPEDFNKFLDTEAENVVTMLNSKLSFLAKDALAFGDGYLAIRGEVGKGITGMVYNLGSKPWSVTPFKSNFHDVDVGYAITAQKYKKNRGIVNKSEVNENQYASSLMNNSNATFLKSLEYASGSNQDVFVLRLDLNDGTLETQEFNDIYLDSYNPFSAEESYYQDSIHSGLLEGQKDAFDKYKGSIDASYSKKIASSIVERFVTISMNHTSVKERLKLKNEMTKLIMNADRHRKGKIDDMDADASVMTHIIPTTGDSATGAVDINESSLDFKDDMEDIMFHAKNLIGGMKFHPQYTAYSDNSEGERQEDSVARTSEQMEEVGGALRSSISKMYRKAIAIHFWLLGNKEIKDDIWEVEYNAITVQSKKEQEYDRLENLNNQSQFNDMVINLKDMFSSDNEKNRYLAREMIKDSVPLNIRNREEFLDNIVEVVFEAPPPMEEGEM